VNKSPLHKKIHRNVVEIPLVIVSLLHSGKFRGRASRPGVWHTEDSVDCEIDILLAFGSRLRSNDLRGRSW